MTYHFRYQKILDVKENEKRKSSKEYEDSVENFKKVATKLYTFLKQKEEFVKLQEEKLNKGMSVQEIKQYQQFVQNLERTIEHYQQLVIYSRNAMNEKQSILMQKHIEVKQYEKIKEKDYKKFMEIRKREEGKMMDEISIITYSFHRN
ncbi:flagellar export protein FliJ [Aeribacillus sp. FSL M8-0235]|uniref:flagellar export protein FliJ n=1 Tax=Aeribacillus sp. FSL M8-0235 TaxID=2954576 RepID=UPI0030F90060